METFNATSQGVRLWDKNIGKAQLNGGLVYTRAAAKDANGRFGWVRGNASCFTDTATPAFEAPVYSSTAATDSSVINIVTVPGDDQITIGGSGLLLQPVTELQYVSMTAASGIVSNGNTLTFNGATAWTDGGLGTIVSGSFCPLEKVNSGALGGNTQYANMYTGGIESAVVTELPGSTGYGTLVNVLSTITSVRPATGTNSATNSYIPTERAVALALAGKENVLSGGACIELDKDVFSTTVSVKTQSGTLPTLANAVNTQVPTERCVRQAIDVTSETLNASASALSTRITNLSSYVIDSTVKKTDYATATSAGIVKPTHGLAIGDNGLLAVSKATVTSDVGNVSAYQGAYTLASGSAIGGVVCTNKIESAGLAEYKNEPIVPTVQAVWDYVSDYGGQGAAVKQGTGIKVTSDTPLTSYTVTLSSALSNVIGGVNVPNNKGITLNNGAISLTEAPMVADYTTAMTSSGTGKLGGVILMSSITAAGTGQTACPVVPTVDAVYQAIQGVEPTVSCAVPISKITEATSSGAIGIKYDTTQFTTTSDGALHLLNTPGGYTTITSGGGVDVAGASDTGYTLTLNRAGNTSSAYGGVWVATGSGLTVITASTDTGKLYLNVAGNAAANLGGVYVPTGNGLSLDTATGQLTAEFAPTYATLDLASAGSMGTVKVLTAVASSNLTKYTNSAYVPNTQAVWNFVDGGYVSNTDYATAESAGIIQPSIGLAMAETSKLVLQPATSDTIGGVAIAPYYGLELNGGTVSVNSTMFNAYRMVHESGNDRETEAKYVIDNQLVMATDGGIAYYNPRVYSGFISAGKTQQRFVTVTRLDDLIVSNATAVGTEGYYKWSSGVTSVFTMGGTVTATAPIYSGYTGNSSGIVIGHVVTSHTGGSMTVARWSASIGTTSSAATETRSSFPIAYMVVDANKNVKIYQFQHGPVVSGLATNFTVSPGTGINVTGSSATGCTVSLAGDVAGSYNGPFQVSSTGTGANNALIVNLKDGLYTSTISSGTPDEQTVSCAGIVSCLDDSYFIRGATFSDVTVPDGGYLYLCGSSGTDAGMGTVTGVVPHTAKFDIGAAPESYATDAGGFATLLAKNSGGKLIQIQYGDITSNHWGDDYKLDYTISRVPITGAPAGYLGYRFIVYSGGKIIGLGANNSIIAWNDIKYPTNTDVNSSDSLYYNKVAYTGGYMEVWLNIWSGTCPAASGGGTNPDVPVWRYVCDSLCYEMDTTRTYANNAYSVQLAYITNNGAPIQIQKGAIDVRGRWA